MLGKGRKANKFVLKSILKGGCNKKKYASREEAEEILQNIKELNCDKRKEQSIYYCLVCNAHHLTSNINNSHTVNISVSKNFFKNKLRRGK